MNTAALWVAPEKLPCQPHACRSAQLHCALFGIVAVLWSVVYPCLVGSFCSAAEPDTAALNVLKQ